MNPWKAARLLVLAGLLVGPASAAPQPLRYRGSDWIDYWVATKEVQERAGPDVDLRTTTIEGLQQITRKVTEIQGGLLRVEVITKAARLLIDGKVIDPGPGALGLRFFVMTPRGERIENRSPTFAESLLPILPEEPQDPGYTWVSISEPDEGVPFDMELKHQLLGEVPARGVATQGIGTRGETAGRDPATKCLYKLSVESGLFLDPVAGTLRAGESNTRSVLRYPKPLADGTQILRRTVKRSVSVRQPGDVDRIEEAAAKRRQARRKASGD